MKYKQLTYYQRSQIYTLLQEKKSKSEVARQIGCHRSTITREMKRNRGKRGYYGHVEAHKRFVNRQKNAFKFTRLTPEMCRKIENFIKQEWSPEQISGYLKVYENIHISHETIYKYVLMDKKSGGFLWKHLRRKCRKYMKRFGQNHGRGIIANRRSIEQRPEIVNQKVRVGDWEADTVMGKNHKGAIVTVVERKTKFTCVAFVEKKSAQLVTQAITRLLEPFKNFVHSITVDNGKEFAYHERIEKALNTKVYFAHPYASYERGLNENTNGLIRQYIPKKSILNKETIHNKLTFIADRLNFRPRKTLNFNNPYNMLYSSMF